MQGRDPEESRNFWSNIVGIREDQTSERGREGPDPNRERRAAADDPVHILEYVIGGTVIEISHPTTTDSGTARLVAQRATLGEVFHHTAPFAPDVHRFYRAGCAGRHGADRQHSAQRGYHAGDGVVPSQGVPWVCFWSLGTGCRERTTTERSNTDTEVCSGPGRFPKSP